MGQEGMCIGSVMQVGENVLSQLGKVDGIESEIIIFLSLWNDVD